MLTVTVTLNPWWGAKDGSDDRVIAQATIYNDGTGNSTHGNYVGMTHNMNTMKVKKLGAVQGHYRDQDVFHLVSKMLRDMNYGC